MIMAREKVILSRDLPGQKVNLPAGSENKSYYKYFLEPFEDISAELKAQLRSSVFGREDTLEPEDRAKLLEVKRWPAKDGVYRLKRGGALVACNVKLPDLTAEQVNWWGAWHGLDPLRYAIWDPQDHYDIHIADADRARILDPNISDAEKLWGMHHKVLESLDQDAPSNIEMQFLNPWECGFDQSLFGTDRCGGILSARAKMMGILPVFMSEVFCKGDDGVNEIRLRFWIGYELQDDGNVKCKIPRFIKFPAKLLSNLMIHNHREYKHLNKILPRLYAEQKDNWKE